MCQTRVDDEGTTGAGWEQIEGGGGALRALGLDLTDPRKQCRLGDVEGEMEGLHVGKLGRKRGRFSVLLEAGESGERVRAWPRTTAQAKPRARACWRRRRLVEWITHPP